ncbi:unnamed protein product [Linum trigynum]|uniref:LOB domain-containing protein n=1 Tax=Linum trigynum TaxID=586398 RepID=A0AAV2G145_9ROSI
MDFISDPAPANTTVTTITPSSPATTAANSSSSSPLSFPHHQSSPTPSSSSPPPAQPPPPAIVSPCAACKILRRRCTAEKCVLAPYFPPTDPAKFTIAHRVFGASNIIKFLQELPEEQRADAVSSMVYEASARIRDPVYGSAGAICQLQKQVGELQAQLAKAQAQVATMQCQQANLMAILCVEMAHHQPTSSSPFPALPPSADDVDSFMMIGSNNTPQGGNSCFMDESNQLMGYLWEPLWT